MRQHGKIEVYLFYKIPLHAVWDDMLKEQRKQYFLKLV